MRPFIPQKKKKPNPYETMRPHPCYYTIPPLNFTLDTTLQLNTWAYQPGFGASRTCTSYKPTKSSCSVGWIYLGSNRHKPKHHKLCIWTDTCERDEKNEILMELTNHSQKKFAVSLSHVFCGPALYLCKTEQDNQPFASVFTKIPQIT